MGGVTITSNSALTLTNGHLTLNADSAVNITKVQDIAPVAVHLKEVNHIDPVTVDAFHVSEIKNIDPITIAKFNVTTLPMVNMTVRQLPAVDMNIRKLPPISVGMHQDFFVPSAYTLRARFLGIEFFRFHLDGETTIVPRDKHRREQERANNRSFPVPAAAGNPAIPSRCVETSTTCGPLPEPVAHRFSRGIDRAAEPRMEAYQAGGPAAALNRESVGDALSFGPPETSYTLPDNHAYSESCVMSGG